MIAPRSFPPVRLVRGTLAVAVILTLGSGPARAQTVGDPPPPATDGGSFDGVLRALDLKPKVTPAPDFVRASRPTGTDYIPVGRAHPERTDKVMTPAEIQATTADLDRARTAQQRRAGVAAPAVPLKKPKGPATAPPKSRVR